MPFELLAQQRCGLSAACVAGFLGTEEDQDAVWAGAGDEAASGITMMFVVVVGVGWRGGW